MCYQIRWTNFRFAFSVVWFSIFIFSTPALASPFDTWVYRAKIRINTEPFSPLTNFPVWVQFGTNIGAFAYSQLADPATATDLRFTASNGTTVLNHEIDYWNTNGQSYVWVQVPHIATTADYFYAYWGRPDTTPPPYATNGATWTNAFVGVWHLNEPTPPVSDFSRQSKNGLNLGIGVNYGQPGQLAQSVQMTQTGGNGGVIVPDCNALDFGTGNFTIEMWERKEQSSSGWSNIGDCGKWWSGASAGLNEWSLGTTVSGGDDRPAFSVEIGTTPYSCTSPDAINLNTWNHLAGVRDGTVIRIYVNGVEKGTLADVSGAVNNAGRDLHFGYFPSSPTLSLRGRIDEARISRVARSASWIYATWLNVAFNTTFIQYGSREYVATSLTIRALSPTGILTNGATLRGQVLHTGGVGNPRVYACYDTIDRGTTGTNLWGTIRYIGTNWAQGDFISTNILGLSRGITYACRWFVTNSSGYDWSDPAVQFRTTTFPTVTNQPASVNRTWAQLRGQITDDGESTPSTWFYYWPPGGPTTVVSKGVQAGLFSHLLTNLNPAITYSSTILSSNLAGKAWSQTNSFQLVSGSMPWFVSPDGDNTVGGSWDSALTNLNSVFNRLEAGDTLYLSGQTFSLTNELDWSTTNLTVRGGYAATNLSLEPGVFDTRRWPTIIRRQSGNMRLIHIHDTTNALLQRVTLREGSVSTIGGGIRIRNTSGFILADCEIRDNWALDANPSMGGGIACENASGVISNCLISGNAADSPDAWDGNLYVRGAGIYLSGGSVIVQDSRILDNRAHDGGLTGLAYPDGIGIWADGTHTIRNCLVAGNHRINDIAPAWGGRGGGIWAENGVTIVNCTLVRNMAEGIRRNAGSVTVQDCILWENSDDLFGSPNLLNSCIEDGDSNGANGCTNANPRFVKGVYLQTNSPCIDAGSVTAEYAGLDNRTTHTNGIADSGMVDLGYHAEGSPSFFSMDIHVSPSGSDTLTGASPANAFRTITKALATACGGETIHLAAGTYGNATETYPLTIHTYGVTIQGTNRNTTIIDAGNVADIRILTAMNLLGPLNFNGLTLKGGKGRFMGGGLYLSNVSGSLIDCIVEGNTTRSDLNWGVAYGAGICAYASLLTVSNSIVRNNTYSSPPFNAYGGGLYVGGGQATIVRTIITNNIAASWYDVPRGGGLYLNGTVSIEHSVVARNTATQGSGLYLAGGNLLVRNITVADNSANGIYHAGGSLMISNSLLWGNTDDIVGTPPMGYSTSQDGYNNGVNGCNNQDPRFVDRTHYHLQSTHGQYENGFFNGGTWNTGLSNSPAIDTCDPLRIPTGGEPDPNGAIVNRGAYGNTETASKSPPLTVTNLPASAIGMTSAQLNGHLLHVGSSNVHLRVYYGTSNGGTNPLSWTTNRYLGIFKAPTSVGTNVTGLANGITHYYRYQGSNSAGAIAWASPATTFVPQLSLAEIANRGVLNEGGPSVTLRGEVTSTGGDNPHIYLCWGPVDGETVTSSWQYVVDMGIRPAGHFSNSIATTTGSNYFYTCYAVNNAGGSWATPSLPFGHRVIRYVATNATGLGTGYNWTDAYPSLETALAQCVSGRTNVIHVKTGRHASALPFTVSESHVEIRGGYQGSETPGACDPAAWPTITTNTSDAQRTWDVLNVTNVLLDGLIISGGHPSGNAAGLYASGVSNLTLRRCIIENNRTGVSGYGGGIFVTASSAVTLEDCTIRNNTAVYDGGGCYLANSSVSISNCTIQANRQNGPSSTGIRGAGILVTGGSLLVRDTLIEENLGTPGWSGWSGGGGLASLGGTHTLVNCLIRYNDTTYGDGLYLTAGTISILNNTLFRNKGYGIYRAGGTCVVSNSILWANMDDVYGGATLYASAIQNGDNFGTNGCIRSHPGFDYLYGLYLTPTSPCVDSGGLPSTNLSLSGYTTQPDGSPDTGLVDMGYHYRSAGNPALEPYRDLYVSPDGNNTNAGTSAGTPFRSITRALQVAAGGNRIHVAGGNYTNGQETFPLVLNQAGIQILGTNRDLTVLHAGNAGRIFTITDSPCTDITIRGLTLTGGYAYKYGGAVYLDRADAVLADCRILTNRVHNADNWGEAFGAGICVSSSQLELTDSLVMRNTVVPSPFSSYGGGIYISGGNVDIRHSVIVTNTVAGWYSAPYGGGVYIASGTHTIANTVVAGNQASYADGIYVNGNLSLANGTVADNGGIGIQQAGGTVTVKNSILWGNGDDLVGTLASLSYSCIEDGDYNGTNQCFMADPAFVDRRYYHLKSRAGNYVDGYFRGGDWSISTVNSSSIDAGDPSSPFQAEPYSAGRAINLGAYGNTPVASKSFVSATVILVR